LKLQKRKKKYFTTLKG